MIKRIWTCIRAAGVALVDALDPGCIACGRKDGPMFQDPCGGPGGYCRGCFDREVMGRLGEQEGPRWPGPSTGPTKTCWS